MDIELKINENDKKRMLEFIQDFQDSSFVKDRFHHNISGTKEEVTKEQIWASLMMGLLTTQQRSGPESAISKFLDMVPSPISLDRCKSVNNIETYIQETLSGFGGIRRANMVAGQVKKNLDWLEKENGWEVIFKSIEHLHGESSLELERETAQVFSRQFNGIGPKQSRNILQELGLTRYVLPIDSRLVKRLKEFNFPIPLSAAALSDETYYQFVEDFVNQICGELDIYPTVFDAILFSSFDGNGWDERKARTST